MDGHVHKLRHYAAVCIAAALGLLGGIVADEFANTSASAGASRPTKLANVRIVWTTPPGGSGPLECYVLRPPIGKIRGWWLCG